MKFIQPKFFAIFLLCFLFSNVQAQTKRALIIGVGDYNKSKTGFNPISAANDVRIISDALEIQGFKKSEITVLRDAAATKKGILAAFDALLNQVGAGDVVVIHYSGHGQQIVDNNGDEIDGLDEAMIPIDAQAIYKKGVYEGENHIRDDELGNWLLKIRNKVGAKGSVLLIMDSCHSGTASRGLTKSRGTQLVFGAKAATAEIATTESGQFGLENEENTVHLAPLICFYGAGAHQLNYEAKDESGQSVGSLSFAFGKAFANAPKNQTYGELFEVIRKEMAVLAPRQTPQFEGDKNRLLLGGEIIGKKAYFTVNKILESNLLEIEGGTLMGVYQGSGVSFFSISTDSENQSPLAKGIVRAADATTAHVEITEGNTEGLLATQALLTDVNYGNMSVKVALIMDAGALKTAILKEIEQYPLISVVPNSAAADVVVENESNADAGESLHLITAQEYVFGHANTANTTECAKAITEQLLAYAQANFLREIAMTNEDVDLHFELIPITAVQVGRGRWQEDKRLNLSDKQDVSGNLAFAAGDFFKISVTNNGFEPAYFAILDFQPDNKINVLVPTAYKTAADYVIQPGETLELPDVFRLGPPFGAEVFKLIATQYPIDFKAILAGKGATRDNAVGTNNPFAQLVAGSFKGNGQTRNAETPNMAAGSCHIADITFSIVAQ